MASKVLTLTIVIAFALASTAMATTWTGTNSSNWFDTLNWDTGTPPEGPMTSFTTYGTGGDLIMSPTATFQPVATAGQTIGGTVINNYASPTPGAISLITFESGSFGDFYNISVPDSDPTARIDYDIQAGAVVNAVNSVVQSYAANGVSNITLAGTLNTGEYFNGGTNNGSFDILAGGLMTIPGDTTGLINGYIGNGYITTSSSGHVVVSEYNAGTDTTSVFAEMPLYPLGDFNQDTKVDSIDFGIMKSNWLTTGHDLNENGEVTGDGLVSLKDFALFKDQLYTGPLSALGIVPEPSSLSLVLLAAAQACFLRRRWRKVA